jgi:hypothetical protein
VLSIRKQRQSQQEKSGDGPFEHRATYEMLPQCPSLG